MRDRLIELIDRADEECKHSKSCKTCSGYNKGSMCRNYHIADHLLANGVIVLPCKVGDTVYYITGIGHNLVKPAKIKEIIISEDGIKDLYVQGDGHNFEESFDIFFLTREEAEQALKGGAE